jgi:hypothetical protein
MPSAPTTRPSLGRAAEIAVQRPAGADVSPQQVRPAGVADDPGKLTATRQSDRPAHPWLCDLSLHPIRQPAHVWGRLAAHRAACATAGSRERATWNAESTQMRPSVRPPERTRTSTGHSVPQGPQPCRRCAGSEVLVGCERSQGDHVVRVDRVPNSSLGTSRNLTLPHGDPARTRRLGELLPISSSVRCRFESCPAHFRKHLQKSRSAHPGRRPGHRGAHDSRAGTARER